MAARVKKWFVFRNNEVLGPFEPQDIRAALRAGDIRAFDMVGQEDSTVRRPLMEVDEIFETKQDTYAETYQRATPYQPQQVNQDLQKVSHGYLGGAANIPKKPPKQAALRKIAQPKKTAKKYFIHRQGNVIGPLTAREIMQAYERGGIPKDARIQKNGRVQKLSVDKFVERYMEARDQGTPAPATYPSAPMPQTQYNRAQPIGNSTLTQLALNRSMDRSLIWVMAMSLIATVLVIGFLAFVLSVENDQKRPNATAQTRPEPTRVTNTRPATTTSPSTKRTPPPRTEAPQSVDRVTYNRPTPTPEPSRPRNVSSSRAPVRQPQLTRAPRPVPVIVEQPKPKPVPVVRVERPTPARKPEPVKRQERAEASRPAPKSSPASGGAKVGVIGDLASKLDSTVKIGPLSYSMSDLNACKGPCRITFRGSDGSVTAIFFKQAYGAQLERKNGFATITGIVQNGGREILLKGVN